MMGAATVAREPIAAQFSDAQIAGDQDEWPALLAVEHGRMVALIRENQALHERLSRLSPLLACWPEYDGWAAAAREYHANGKRRGGR